MLHYHTNLHIFQGRSIIGSCYFTEVLLPHIHLLRGEMYPQFPFMYDNTIPHHTVTVAELLESEDIQHINWPTMSPRPKCKLNVYETFRNIGQDITSHQQRIWNYDWHYKRNGLRFLNSSLIISYPAWIDDANPAVHTGVTTWISPTKDWTFLASHLSHGHFCLLFSCDGSYLFNKVTFLSFDFFFWKFCSLFPYICILGISSYDLCWFGVLLHDITFKKHPVLNFCILVYILIFSWMCIFDLENS